MKTYMYQYGYKTDRELKKICKIERTFIAAKLIDKEYEKEKND